MRLTSLLTTVLQRTRALPPPVRYAATTTIVLVMFILARSCVPFLPEGYPFSLFYVAILLSAALFDRGSGFVATGLSAILATYSFLPPVSELVRGPTGHLAVLLIFIAIGSIMALILEALHTAVADLQRSNTILGHSERARDLLLREFRHRTRNDLGSLVGLLMLRARGAPSEVAREALREAAQHALALARVHTHLTPPNDVPGPQGDEAGMVDTAQFVLGLCADLDRAQFGEGLRSVALVPEAEAHALDTERAVPLGLVLNEAVTNALKYAFPEDQAGSVHVRFRREGDEFVLTVEDDGVGLPEEGSLSHGMSIPTGAGLGTRLLRALATQVRGRFTRRSGEGGTGTTIELRFPVTPPAERRSAARG